MANKSKVVKFKPAGKDDDFAIFTGFDLTAVPENEKFELKTAKKGVERGILSTELKEGSTLKAYDGGKPNIVDFDSKRDKIEARNKTTNIEEYKKSKQKSSDREIG